MNAVARRWHAVPMRDWPAEAFEQLGLRNPYEPGNLTIRRQALVATRNLGGAVVECGSFRGQGLATLAWLMREAGIHVPSLASTRSRDSHTQRPAT